MKNFKVLIIDSGVGGVSLLKEFINKTLIKNYIYFADLKNIPYGMKNKKELFNITKNNIQFLSNKYHPKYIVFGCNTIGTTILEEIKNYFINIKFFSIKPNIDNFLNKNMQQKVLVLATNSTIKALKNKLDCLDYRENIELCKMSSLANKIEENLENISKIEPYLKNKLEKYKNFSFIILGCTHYYFVSKEIKNIIINSQLLSGVDKVVDDFIENVDKTLMRKTNINFSTKEIVKRNKINIKWIINSNIKKEVKLKKRLYKNLLTKQF